MNTLKELPITPHGMIHVSKTIIAVIMFAMSAQAFAWEGVIMELWPAGCDYKTDRFQCDYLGGAYKFVIGKGNTVQPGHIIKGYTYYQNEEHTYRVETRKENSCKGEVTLYMIDLSTSI